MRFQVQRYNPETDKKPYLKEYVLDNIKPGTMLRDALLEIKAQDETLTFRHSCGEGVCGSDAMNINGTNGLACLTSVAKLSQPIVVRSVPGMPIIRDLVVDMSQFYHHYRAIKPYLIVHDPVPEVEYLQSPEDRDKLDGLYECILCGACTTACPSFWWNPDKFRGPAALLQAYRFLADSRDQATDQRLQELDGPYRMFRCHTIMNCTNVCPKGLNPSAAIHGIKTMMLKEMI